MSVFKIGWSIRGRVYVEAENEKAAEDVFYASIGTGDVRLQRLDDDGYEIDFVESAE